MEKKKKSFIADPDVVDEDFFIRVRFEIIFGQLLNMKIFSRMYEKVCEIFIVDDFISHLTKIVHY